jgi:hypothetical protein
MSLSFSEGAFQTSGQRFLVNDQREAQLFSMYLFLFLTLYVFRPHRAYHQERQIVSVQPLVAITLCRWPGRVQVGSEASRWSFTKNHYTMHGQQNIKIVSKVLYRRL